jgi:hypothetical protein
MRSILETVAIFLPLFYLFPLAIAGFRGCTKHRNNIGPIDLIAGLWNGKIRL